MGHVVKTELHPSRSSRLIGLIGEGVSPSLTPPMHEFEGARHGISYVYRPVDTTPGEAKESALGDLVSMAERFGFNGLNITYPYKQLVVPLLDELSDDARRLGAVNTVLLENGKRIGFNTDVTGFHWALGNYLADAPKDRVLLLGAGGAGTAVAAALTERALGHLVIVDQDPSRARALAERVTQWGHPSVSAAPLEHLAQEIVSTDGIVNATPSGMAAHPGTAFDVNHLHDRLWVADVVYRPAETALLRAARERGLRVMSGLGMAMGQAADAFEIFTGRPADREAMLADLQSLVAAEASHPILRSEDSA